MVHEPGSPDSQPLFEALAIDLLESYTREGLRVLLIMRRRRLAAFAWFLPVCISGGWSLAVPAPSPVLASPLAPPISGIVSHLENPIGGVLVILYNLGDTSLTRSRTAPDGTFVLASAPVGVYDLIAYKSGFLPALVRLWHQPASAGVSAVRIQLAARSESARGRKEASSIWDLRDKLPADVLREIELEAGTQESAPPGRVRIDKTVTGEVRTVSDVAQGDSSLSRTAVGVRGGLPNGWQYDLRGDYAAVSDSAGISDTSATTGNAAGLALDVAMSPLDRVSLTTRRHTLSLHDDRVASLQTHGVSWSRDGEEGSVESVAARYVEEANLYRATSPGSNFFPLASRTWEVRANYARPATESPGVAASMTYRHREGTIGPSGVGSDGAFLMSAPDGDLSAASSVRVSSRTEVEGGVVARYLAGGYGIAPRLGARYDLGDKTYVFVRGLYRVVDSGAASGSVLPLVSSVDENGDATSGKGFTVGIERRSGPDASFRAEVSNHRVNEAVRAFFEGDFLTDFDSVPWKSCRRERGSRCSCAMSVRTWRPLARRARMTRASSRFRSRRISRLSASIPSDPSASCCSPWNGLAAPRSPAKRRPRPTGCSEESQSPSRTALPQAVPGREETTRGRACKCRGDFD